MTASRAWWTDRVQCLITEFLLLYQPGPSATFSCLCRPFFKGRYCTEPRDPCTTKPCFANETCHIDRSNVKGYSCVCKSVAEVIPSDCIHRADAKVIANLRTSRSSNGEPVNRIHNIICIHCTRSSQSQSKSQ